MATALKLLRTKPNVTDDDDFVGTQAAPADTVTFVGAAPQSGGRTIDAVEIVIEWLDVSNDRVNGAGSLTVQLVPVFVHPVTGVADIIADSQTFSTQGYRPIFITGVQEEDVVGVRLTGITPPATTTQVRVLYREVRV